MITPPYLKAGDKVGLISTARKVDLPDLKNAIELLENWGLVPVLGATIGATEDQYAGSDTLRRDDLQRMLNDTSIKTIWCAKGGYGTVRIIDGLDFYKFVKYPKWIAGYSDVTVLHSHLNRMGFETIHAVMGKGVEDNSAQAKESLHDALFGKPIKYQVDSHPLNRMGTSSGQLVGGNISIIYSLCGSPSAIATDGKILFIEDLDEYLYHVDRMMVNLKRNGLLKNLCGLVVGGLTRMHDNSVPFGKNAKEIVLDAVAEYAYPVCFDFPAGHLDDNRALIMGRKATLDVSENSVQLDFTEV
ncbi:LD-carboxypeptidase [Flavimarina sp. Hel_I_48]|uniref:S66 peptidase family protein n=1 Tax=Flavimarina sp. Hel_I_48 TaxID=1392488 RepID=UPI0004DF7EC9|nr:LD-carboxypeptidase [Flavimarina sp. Hel_I_48]